MDPIWWVVLSVFSASVSGGLVYFVMSSSTSVKLARQREKLAAAQAALGAQKEAMMDSVKYAKESARREALDDFLSDIRIEERHYVREHKALFITRKSVVRQERIFFRNLPLSNWIEQEMPYEEGADIDALARTMAVFAPEALIEADAVPPRRLLR
ncbi:MAG TPA: hypothetical protein VHA14_14610 [Bryobacteraceae bacterium]|nr:hypothetical protein [Bryobacteraceae bacterium]